MLQTLRERSQKRKKLLAQTVFRVWTNYDKFSEQMSMIRRRKN